LNKTLENVDCHKMEENDILSDEGLINEMEFGLKEEKVIGEVRCSKEELKGLKSALSEEISGY
jgi:hypothetical protein